MGWADGLHVREPLTWLSFDATGASDEVAVGRLAPFMIFRAMELCKVDDVRKVFKMGGTPSDLIEGKRAGCRCSFGVTNGTHTAVELDQYENDGLFESLVDFNAFLQRKALT